MITPTFNYPSSGGGGVDVVTNDELAAVSLANLAGCGANVKTALAVAVGSAGSILVNGGAGGTPSSLTLTNATGLPPAGVTGTAAILGANTFTGLQTMTELRFGTAGTNWRADVIDDYRLRFLTNGGTSGGGFQFGGGLASAFAVSSGFILGFCSGNFAATNPDLLLGRDAAAQLRLGANHATSPTHQGFKAHDGITNANIAAAALALGGGLGTGTARAGDLIGKTGESGSTGTTTHLYTTRRYDSAKWVDLTDATAVTIASVAVPAGKYAGLKLVCTVSADDATDFQALTSELIVSAVNKAGTVTSTLDQIDGVAAVSAGTLACTYTVVANGNAVDIQANAVSSLTETTLRAKWSIVSLNTNATDTSLTTGSVVTPS